MPIATVIMLLQTFGPGAMQLITSLINTWESNGVVTAAQWTALTASLNQSAGDRMTAQLKAAGIDPASPQGVAMLALVGK